MLADMLHIDPRDIAKNGLTHTSGGLDPTCRPVSGASRSGAGGTIAPTPAQRLNTPSVRAPPRLVAVWGNKAPCQQLFQGTIDRGRGKR